MDETFESLLSSLCSLSSVEEEDAGVIDAEDNLSQHDCSVRSDIFDVSDDGDLDVSGDYSIRSDVFESSSVSAATGNDLPSESTVEDTNSPFAEMNVDKSFLEPLYVGANLTVFESYSLLLQYSLRHGLTKQAFSDLLQLVGTHIPTGSMASLYKVKKFFLELYGDVTFQLHHCCAVCHSYLESESATCPQNCDGSTIEFLSIPISSQLKRRMEGQFH